MRRRACSDSMKVLRCSASISTASRPLTTAAATPRGRAAAGRRGPAVPHALEETDTVARLGGDEFAILQSALDRDDDAEILAQRILKAVGRTL
jgi:hypothetical protein